MKTITLISKVGIKVLPASSGSSPKIMDDTLCPNIFLQEYVLLATSIPLEAHKA